jgi:putative NADH-flavin reductase
MKIVVFGSSGMIGQRITDELSRRGHEVVAATRATGADVTSPASVASVAAGTQAIVCAISARGVDYTLADVARALLEGARRAGVRRVIVVGGAGSLEVSPGVRLLDTPDFPAEYRQEAVQGADALQYIRGIDDLDWTYVSPAAMIAPGERRGAYRLGGDELLSDPAGHSQISAEDYAIAVADLVESGDHVRERVGVAW